MKQTKGRNSFQKQFFSLLLAVSVGTVLLCLLMNNLFLERFYTRHKKRAMNQVYLQINQAAEENTLLSKEFQSRLQEMAEKYSIALLVLDRDSQVVITTSGYSELLTERLWKRVLEGKVSSQGESKYRIEEGRDTKNGPVYMECWGFLGNGTIFLMRTALTGIHDSVQFSNRFMGVIAFVAVFFCTALSYFFSSRFTRPVSELTRISERMKNLDFDAKYSCHAGNELDFLGQNINELSEILLTTISEWKAANIELKKDIKQKEEIDEQRREFLSNVSHELKTPIALIQGYAEGLKEAVNDDPASKDDYCDVIMDEAARMNTMVQKLMTLDQLESGGDPVRLERFSAREMVQNFLKSADILARQKNANVQLAKGPDLMVWADEFKAEEVLRNFFTNALNHLDGERLVEISLEKMDHKVRISVFNTGEPIPEEALPHLFEKFYKVDKARSRAYGGNGIGLSIVKAIMDSLHQTYGVKNYKDGVCFYFDLEADR